MGSARPALPSPACDGQRETAREASVPGEGLPVEGHPGRVFRCQWELAKGQHGEGCGPKGRGSLAQPSLPALCRGLWVLRHPPHMPQGIPVFLPFAARPQGYVVSGDGGCSLVQL